MYLPCLPLVLERHLNAVKERGGSVRYPQVEMRMFPQTWGSTALGFGGVGGQAITGAYTVVVMDDETGWCSVFFGERLAYCIHNPNQIFFEDISKEDMSDVAHHSKYLRGVPTTKENI